MVHRVVALSLAALSLMLAQMQANAAEGKLSESSAALDAKRTSSYRGGRVSAALEAASGEQATSKPLNHTGKSIPAKQTRALTTMSARSSDFYIREATSTLRSDRDGDGYHAEFRVRFDADVIVGDAYVYARLYLRRAGESEWYLYHETDDFYIDGESSSDEYYVTTTLDGGYPTGEYDVLIDLYESGYSGIVATIGPLDSPALSYLPLEEIGLDVPIAIDGYSIGEVTTELIRDADGDGHYSRFRITFDPDTDFDGRLVYARVWVRPRGGEWIEEFATENFWVDSSGQSDAYELSVEWFSGYPTSLYDVQIDLYEAATNLLAASAGSERSALGQIPLEDQSRDQFVNLPDPGSGGDSSSLEGGGGALGWGSLLGLLALGLVRFQCRSPRRT
jgi:hypothetical protein